MAKKKPAKKPVKKTAKPAKKVAKKPVKKASKKPAKKAAKPTRKVLKVSKAKAKPKTTTKKKATTRTKVVNTDKLFHALIPEHKKLTKEEAEAVYKKYNVTQKEMPRMLSSDPAIRHLGVKEGDVIEISRKSLTATNTKYYRSVINE